MSQTELLDTQARLVRKINKFKPSKVYTELGNLRLELVKKIQDRTHLGSLTHLILNELEMSFIQKFGTFK